MKPIERRAVSSKEASSAFRSFREVIFFTYGGQEDM